MMQDAAAAGLRIDKLLWFLRLARSRSRAQALVREGHIRCNGIRVERAHQRIAAGDILTIPLGKTVRVIELLSIPARRGPAPEAQGHYRALDAPGSLPIAARPASNYPKGETIR